MPTPTPRLTLASASPRRHDLIGLLGLDAIIRVADVDETPLADEDPGDLVVRLALAKAGAVASMNLDAGQELGPVLGADTVVVCDGEVQGKPRDAADARRMLLAQAGRDVVVTGGIAVVEPETGRRAVARAETTLHMHEHVDPDLLAAYVASGESDDKAGALSVQGGGAAFVAAITGCWTNVLGLALCETVDLLRDHGFAGLAHTCHSRAGQPCPRLSQPRRAPAG